MHTVPSVSPAPLINIYLLYVLLWISFLSSARRAPVTSTKPFASMCLPGTAYSIVDVASSAPCTPLLGLSSASRAGTLPLPGLCFHERTEAIPKDSWSIRPLHEFLLSPLLLLQARTPSHYPFRDPANPQTVGSSLELVLQSLLRPPVWYSVSPPTRHRPLIDRSPIGGPREVTAKGRTTPRFPAPPSPLDLALRGCFNTTIRPTAPCRTNILRLPTPTGRSPPKCPAVRATLGASLGTGPPIRQLTQSPRTLETRFRPMARG